VLNRGPATISFWSALAFVVSSWTGSQALAAPCLDGRFLVAGASPLGAAGADSEVIELVGGVVAMRGGCPPTAAVVSGAASPRLAVTWPACGSSTDVTLRAKIAGRDCRTLRGSLRATRDGRRRRWRVRARRVEAATTTIVPEPVAAWRPINGGAFVVTPRTKVLVDRDRPEVARVAEYLVALLRRQGLTRGTVTPWHGHRQPRNSLLLTTADADPTLGAEGYVLRVTSSRVILRAPTAAGLF
jgi:hypothetical protein